MGDNARMSADRRLLLVHAHPDDETITNGATMAKYAHEGAHVTLVTCTRGEEGEVVLPELGHLAADRDDSLGEHRVQELATAMQALGVSDHRFLGEEGQGHPPRRYRDSGMAQDEQGLVIPVPQMSDDAFALADVDEAAGRLAAVIRGLRPQVVVTYDPGGGYGHPDHIQTHRVTMRAVQRAAERGATDAWDVPKVYWSVLPERLVRQAMEELATAENNPFEGWDAGGQLPSMVVPDEQVTTRIDAADFVDAKIAAMRAHATQISVEDGFFALSNGVGRPMLAVEFYRLVKGVRGGPDGEDGRETDLFAGL